MTTRFKQIEDTVRIHSTVTKTDSEYGEVYGMEVLNECLRVLEAGKPGVNQVPGEVAIDQMIKNIKAYFEV